MSVSGKHVVITGGGSGIGASLAEAFSAEGANVSILGRGGDKLDAVARRTGAFAFVADVTDRAMLDDALDQARAKQGPIDIAIANAGSAQSTPFKRLTPEHFSESLAVNLEGVFHLWQAVYPDMLKAGWGRLIAIASTAGLKGYLYVSHYCAAKHGVVGLTRALALELAQSGITVNSVCPGFVETPLLDRSIESLAEKTGMTQQAAAETLLQSNPQNRFIKPEEVSGAALWLCSASAASTNGHTLTLSGGEI